MPAGVHKFARRSGFRVRVHYIRTQGTTRSARRALQLFQEALRSPKLLLRRDELALAGAPPARAIRPDASLPRDGRALVKERLESSERGRVEDETEGIQPPPGDPWFPRRNSEAHGLCGAR